MIGYCVVRPQCHEFCVECLFVHVSPGGGGEFFLGGGGGTQQFVYQKWPNNNA